MKTVSKSLVTSLAVCLMFAAPVLANSLETARKECNSDDSDKAIRGCSTLLGYLLDDAPLTGKQKTVVAKVYYSRGLAYAKNSKPNQAIKDYSSAIQNNANHLGAHVKRGYLYFDQRKLDKAFADFDQATRIEPRSFHAFAFRGMTYAANGEHRQAVADFDRALKRKADATTRQVVLERRAASIKKLKAQE